MTILAVEIALPLWLNKNNVAVQFFIKVFLAIGIVVLTRLAVGLVGNLTNRTLKRLEPTRRKFLTQAVQTSLVVCGSVAFLNKLGIETTSIVAIVGAAGLAVGLALQNTLSHFAAGVLLIGLHPFEVGDFIEGAGVAGVVDSIGIFSTTVVTPDNVQITVPNGQLFSNAVKNTTAMGTRRVDLEVDIGDRPIEPTITHLLALVQPHPLILNKPPPTCHVFSISALTTVLYLRPWCASEVYEQVRSEVQQLVKEALNELPNPAAPNKEMGSKE